MTELKLNSLFYCVLESSQSSYKISPPGTLDINQLVQGKNKYWLDPNPMTENKKKHLVFADYLSFASDKHIENIKNKIIQLISDGFNVYIFLPNNVVLLNSNIIDNYFNKNVLSTINVTPDEEIETYMLKFLKVPKDELYILNPLETQKLLEDNYSLTKYKVIISENEEAFINQQWINNLLLYKDKVEIINNIIDLRNTSIVNTIANKLTIIDHQPKEVILLNALVTQEQINRLFNENTDSVKNINTVNSNISEEAISQLLIASPNIEKLDLSLCKNIKNLSLGITQLNKLKTINLNNSTISPEGINQLLKASPNIEELDLSDCKKIQNLNLLGIPQLNKLKNINLKGSTISPEGINQLLKASPNIEELDLSYYQNLQNLNLLGITQLNKLKKINLKGSTISPEGIKQLLTTLPNIEELTLQDSNSLSY
ncbi:hypothetical protein L3V82_12310 [Thiotrichales bacterium 19S3-7]|nr:hypothetical protein [Thiotrichales bacterium 19S3-7]MCF6802973.1 hypothetical protein [Thiotrichales bacterium 19S3-11]